MEPFKLGQFILGENTQAFFKQHKLGFVSCLDMSWCHDLEKNLDSPHPLAQDLEQFSSWLQNNKSAVENGLSFLHKNQEARHQPKFLLPDIQTAFVFLIPYAKGSVSDMPSVEQQAVKQDPNQPIKHKIGRYAWVPDYHHSVKQHLQQVFETLATQYTLPHLLFRPIIDSAPFLDRVYAKQAGLGFVGKNTMLIRPGLGSYFFIASVLTNYTIEQWQQAGLLQTTQPMATQSLPSCGTCRRCIDACPTHALLDYQLVAHNCLAYWTIERKSEPIPQNIQDKWEQIFGCDICQEVCPYNWKPNVNIDLLDAFNSLPQLEYTPKQFYQWVLQSTKKEWQATAFGRVPKRKMLQNIDMWQSRHT
jgi:epoxyqueuosine reductase